MSWIGLFFALLLIVMPRGAGAEYKTIDDLAKAYSDASCKGCHAKVHNDWKSSYHSQSIVHSLGGIRNFITVGLGQEWKQPVSKAHLMRCMSCHAPMLKDATEDLAKKVAGLIVTAVDDKDEGKKAAAKTELAKLNVNCVICHNTMVSLEKNLVGAPKPGVYYSPEGKASPAHKTERSPAMSTALFCGQCHGIHTPPDGDAIVCNTLYGSYQDAYRANGGSETCQDCHMKAKDRGHKFPGAYETEVVRDGIGLDFQAAAIRLHPGKWIPTAVVNIGLINKAGHRIPDGWLWSAKVVLEVTAKTDKGTVVPIGKKEYWELGMDMDGYHRVGAWQIKEVIDLTLPPRKTTKEQFVAELPEGTTSADVEVKVTYLPAPKTELVIHKATKKLTFK